MDSLQGVVDTSEPYWTVDSLYKDMPRVWTFEAGCTTLGYQSNFFTMVPSLEAAATSESSDKPYVLPLAITAVMSLSGSVDNAP